MSQLIKVLDHGFVRLCDSMGGDISVSRSARISYNAEWRAGEDTGSDARLIKYLYKHKHTSPFESVVFTFDVKAPIFVFRQWQRHRAASYNELSYRYAKPENLFYVPRVEDIGVQSKDNKQVRDLEPGLVPGGREEERARYIEFCERAFGLYEDLIVAGWPREVARGILPMATYSHMFWTVNLHNLFHFLRLRDHAHAQKEIALYAQAIKELIRPIVPVCMEAFEAS